MEQVDLCSGLSGSDHMEWVALFSWIEWLRHLGIFIEDLDFKHLKQRMLYENKKRNKTLSEFAYQKILEKIERKCMIHEVDVIRINPRNTSKIGKEKYSKIKGLGVHYCAAYVIARKGMGLRF